MRPHMCLLVLVLATSVIAGTQDVNPPYVAFISGAESNLPQADAAFWQGTREPSPL